MEKLEKKKHDHSLTKWLKFTIFAIIMIAPFFSVLSKCVYVATNRNAKESYYGETINEEKKQYFTKNNQILNKYNVYFENSKIENTTKSGTITYLNVKIESGDYANNTEENNKIILNSNRIYFYRGSSITFYDDNNNKSFLMTGINGVVLKFDNIYTLPNTDLSDAFFEIIYNKYSYLDNVFEYSVDQLNNDNLYNWSKQTAIYNAIYKMTSGLGANEVLAMLLAYWGILTAIYIVFDIVIECFTKLTHLLAE